MRRALTLVEVVAATALLTMILAVCIPLLRGARTDLAAAREDPAVESRRVFEEAVDELLRQRPGLAELAIDRPEGLDEEWGHDGQRFGARIRAFSIVREDAAARRSSHAWLVFRSGELEVPRWVRVRGGAEGQP